MSKAISTSTNWWGVFRPIINPSTKEQAWQLVEAKGLPDGWTNTTDLKGWVTYRLGSEPTSKSTAIWDIVNDTPRPRTI